MEVGGGDGISEADQFSQGGGWIDSVLALVHPPAIITRGRVINVISERFREKF